MTDTVHTHAIGPWRFCWVEGARLADVFHLEASGAIDCFEVGFYDWEAPIGRSRATVADFRRSAAEWVRDHGDEFARELPYLY